MCVKRVEGQFGLVRFKLFFTVAYIHMCIYLVVHYDGPVTLKILFIDDIFISSIAMEDDCGARRSCETCSTSC